MNHVEREGVLLAPYAMHAVDSAGRATPEPDHAYRSPYQRDRDRITHSSAFRRLSHKTQVFSRDFDTLDTARTFGSWGDYYRSRLTHTLEVASIARTLARALRLNEDLVEALALAHDVGHPPFGHAGEEVLDQRLAGAGGFNHNHQAVRIFTRLERRYPDRPGLNLSAEVLEGQAARALKPRAGAAKGEPPRVRPASPLLETQVVDAADSIAYDSHDADDALELGLLSLADLEEASFWRESVARMQRRYAALDEADLRRATVHDLIDRQVSDLYEMVSREVHDRGLDSTAAVRAAGPIARLSPQVSEQVEELEALLFARVYRHPQVLAHRRQASAALAEWFDYWLARPDSLPPLFRKIADEESPERAVADCLASLTDRAVLRRPPG
ncbi:dGTP triphosphohydrolase [Botrimarina sp.]|uniref:dGTP triphosphohydrolase n=1 Tax=Botrimarina sp. TaxID=2795802 RepID=UPI0032EACC67